jgi:hypothetical protein
LELELVMDGRCKDCRWWKKKDARYGDLPNKCYCPKITHEDDRRHFEDGDGGKLVPVSSDVPNDGADICDASGYYAALLPSPGFGCIHWEAKSDG